MVENIREFDQKQGEHQHTFQWSHDGNFIAKKFTQEVTSKKDEGAEELVKTKTGMSIYRLPSMELIENDEGHKKSLTIDGVEEF